MNFTNQNTMDRRNDELYVIVLFAVLVIAIIVTLLKLTIYNPKHQYRTDHPKDETITWVSSELNIPVEVNFD